MNRYQTLGKRFLALIVDTVVFLPFVAIATWLDSASLSPVVNWTLMTLSTVVNLAYTIILHWMFGQTLGKMVAKVKVVDVVSEGAISPKQAFLRDVVYVGLEALEVVLVAVVVVVGVRHLAETAAFFDTYFLIPVMAYLAIDILVCIKSAKNRALHDFIAGTVVVDLTVQAEGETAKMFDPPSPDAYDRLRSGLE